MHACSLYVCGRIADERVECGGGGVFEEGEGWVVSGEDASSWALNRDAPNEKWEMSNE